MMEEPMSRRYAFEREFRTPYSEGYILIEDDTEIGRVDLHFTPGVIRATLCVPDGRTDDEVQEIVTEIEDQLAMSGDMYRDEEFTVTVWAGHSGGDYSTEDEWDEDEDEDEEDEEEMEGNGHRP
jgi:hypothetical protein